MLIYTSWGYFFYSVGCSFQRAASYLFHACTCRTQRMLAVSLVCATPQLLALSSSPVQSCGPQIHLSSDNESNWLTLAEFVITEYLFG